MKKQTLAQDAFKLYAENFMTLEDIARQLHLNERTLRRWKKSDDWETKRAEYLRTKTTLHSDLYDFARSLINSIERDMENNGKVEPARYYAVTKMLKLIEPVKSYEDEVISEKQKLQEEKPKSNCFTLSGKRTSNNKIKLCCFLNISYKGSVHKLKKDFS